MTVKELALNEGFKTISLPSPDRVIDGVYVGDLLSWVMGRAEADNAWITIMSNLNVIAVATLADVACVILSEGVTVNDEVSKLAESKGVNILSTNLTSYETSVYLSGALK